MKNLLVFALIAALCVGVSYAEPAKAEAKAVVKAEVKAGVKVDDKARKDFDTALLEAIRLLEAKEYLAMAKNFMPPSELKGIIGQGTIEDFVADWSKGGAERMLVCLKAVKDVAPRKMSDNKIVYPMPEGVDKDVKVIWLVKEGEYWYVTAR